MSYTYHSNKPSLLNANNISTDRVESTASQKHIISRTP